MKNIFASFKIICFTKIIYFTGLLSIGSLTAFNPVKATETGASPYGDWGKGAKGSADVEIFIRERPDDHQDRALEGQGNKWKSPQRPKVDTPVIGSRKKPEAEEVRELPGQAELQRVQSDLAEEVQALRELLQSSQGPKEETPFDPEQNPVSCLYWVGILEGFPIAQEEGVIAKRGFVDPYTQAPLSQPPLPGYLQNKHDAQLQAWKEARKRERREYQEAKERWEKAEQSGAEDREIHKAAFKSIQKKLLAVHWVRDESSRLGNRPRSVKELEEEILYRFRLKSKDLTPAYGEKKPKRPDNPASRKGKDRIKCLTCTDPVEVRIGCPMLESRIAYLRRENEIFKAILTGFKSTYEPKVRGVKTTVSKWWSSSSIMGTPYWGQPEYQALAESLRGAYQVVGIEHREYKEPVTDEERVLRLFGLDNLGKQLAASYPIKKYEELQGNERTDMELDRKFRDLEERQQYFVRSELERQKPKKPFLQIYKGADVFCEDEEEQSRKPVLDSGRFHKVLKTKFLRVQSSQIYLYSDEDKASYDRGECPQGTLVLFVPSKGTHVMTEYCAPDRFERTLRYEVMNELLGRKGAFVKRQGDPIQREYTPTEVREQFDEYKRLYKEYKGLHGENIQLLSDLQVSPFWFGRDPVPYDFFFSRKPVVSASIQPSESLDLREKGITDRHVEMWRPLPEGHVEPVFERCRTLDLRENNVKFEINFLETSLPCITELNVSGNDIAGLGHVCSLTSLQTLNLSHNPLKLEAEGEIPVMPHLEELHMSSIGRSVSAQQIGAPLTFIPTMAQVASLKVLNLSLNGIVCLDPLKQLLQLEVLNLSGNRIEDLEPLSGLTHLRVLNISENYLTSLTCLMRLENLESLERLYANNLILEDSSRRTMFQSWMTIIPPLKGLSCLSVKGNKITWFPYKNGFSTSFSRNDVDRNDKAFTERLPSLEVFTVAEGVEVKKSGEGPILLSSLDKFTK